MNQLIKTVQNTESNEILVSGRELHDFLESNERYSKWFERMKDYGFSEGVDFTSVQKSTLVNNGAERLLDDHHLRLDMAKEIAMIQRSDKGREARQYFIQVEKNWNNPEMIIKRALDLQQHKILTLETEIQENKRYTDFGKVVSMSDGSINIGAFAKLIFDNHGIKIGRNKLIEWLREQGYLMKKGREKNFPKQRYVEMGLFELMPTIIKRTQGDVQGGTTLITGKGQVKIAEHLKRELGVS